MYYLIGIDTKRLLFKAPSLAEVHVHVVESTQTHDVERALECLGAEITVDLTVCAEMQREAYMEGYKRSTARRQTAVAGM